MEKKNYKDLNQFISEQDEFKTKFQMMIEEAKLEQSSKKFKSNKLSKTSEDEKKYKQLKEKAKDLIAKAKENQINKLVTDTDNGLNKQKGDESFLVKNDKYKDSNDDLEEKNCERVFKTYRVKKVKDLPSLKKKLDSRMHDIWDSNDDPIDNINLKQKTKKKPIKSHFANYELKDLEKELEKTEKEKNYLEIKRRQIFDDDENTEKYYTRKWLELVNKSNAVVRRQMQLNLVENEKNLNDRYDLLNKELQTLVNIEESQKTDAQKQQEKILLDELLKIVNKRAELVFLIDSQEKAVQDDADAIDAAEKSSVNIETLVQEEDKNCSIM